MKTIFKSLPARLLFRVFAALTVLSSCSPTRSPGVLELTGSTTIYTSATPGNPLYKAVLALQRDLQKTLGGTSVIKPLTQISEPGIVVLNDNEDKLRPTISGWEAHHVYIDQVNNTRQVIMEGADTRGAIYAIYTFCENVLGVPPLWYFSSWTATQKHKLPIPASLNIRVASPDVKYRAWFPNDTDLFDPWRKASEENDNMWLETALRLKLNTIEWNDTERDYGKPYSVSPATHLINSYGLVNTTHHHSPVNASFAGWDDYWRKTRDTVPPELLLANEKYLEEFWRYNAECIVKNNINMLWVVGFRGNGDHPFWYTFTDAPTSMKERGEVISKMMEKQREIVKEVTHNPNTQFRTIFYDELSDLLAQGYIHPPADTSFIWTYVAARRDHYPNDDIQQLQKEKNLRLGYYFNYQFTSTGSHLAAGEGPWKMEKNFQYVQSKSNKPIAFSVVNAGNIREFVMELSANAAMMWNFKSYSSDGFLKDFCAEYYGSENAAKAASIYTSYYNAYWKPRQPELAQFNRQFIFQDLRYKKAIQEIAGQFNEPFNPNPLKDIGAEQVKGRTYRIIPADNNATNQVDAIINGTSQSAQNLLQATKNADDLYNTLSEQSKPLFNDNLREPAYYMYYLNESLLQLCKAYKATEPAAKKQLVQQAVAALKQAQTALLSTQHGRFAMWYNSDRIFGFKAVIKSLDEIKAGQ